MPSEPLLDFEALTLPIPGDDPAGGPVSFAAREALDEARKEIDPSQFDKEDVLRPTEVQRADWAGIVRMAQEILVGTSKDLLIAARLTEALVKLHGFAGLRDGLRLIRELVANCWERLRPPIEEEGDVEVRAAAIIWLDDPNRGARFPTTIQQIPLVIGAEGGFSWLDWKRAQKAPDPDRQPGAKKDDPAEEDFDAAVRSTSTADCRLLVEDIDASLEEIDALTAVLAERMGDYAPSLTGIRQATLDCEILARQILAQKPAEIPTEEAPPADEPAEDAATAAERATPRPATSRAQLYAQVAAAAAALKQIEPHSPIPYLLERAVGLGAMPFPELMKVLVRNPEVLQSMNRELGIEDGGVG